MCDVWSRGEVCALGGVRERRAAHDEKIKSVNFKNIYPPPESREDVHICLMRATPALLKTYSQELSKLRSLIGTSVPFLFIKVNHVEGEQLFHSGIAPVFLWQSTKWYFTSMKYLVPLILRLPSSLSAVTVYLYCIIVDVEMWKTCHCEYDGICNYIVFIEYDRRRLGLLNAPLDMEQYNNSIEEKPPNIDYQSLSRSLT